MPEKMGYAHNEKPESKAFSIKKESLDDDGAPNDLKSDGSAFARALKAAKSECDQEHTKVDGVATRENGPSGGGKGSSKSTYGAGVD